MKRLDGAPRKRLTPGQCDYIAARWPTETGVAIAAALGVEVGTVKSYASRNDLRKDPEMLSHLRAKVAGKERLPIARSKTGRRKTNPSPLGTHVAMLLGGGRPIDLPAIAGRVHRILDDIDELQEAA